MTGMKNPGFGDAGPFDLIGDVHGCYDELVALLEHLGYRAAPPRREDEADWEMSGEEQTIPGAEVAYTHPEGRKAVFLGDLVDRGPRNLDVVALVSLMVREGSAYCVLGNHDDKFRRALMGNKVRIAHGLENTMRELSRLKPPVRRRVSRTILHFLERRPAFLLLDEGRLVAAHAGLKENLQGRMTAKAREFALYGETTGETDEYGLPVRVDWPGRYEGEAMVVYGHTPVEKPVWRNNTLNVDTGCVFGGHLTALRYPELEQVSEPARRVYWNASKPFAVNAALTI